MNEESTVSAMARIRELLVEVYGSDLGEKCFAYAVHGIERFASKGGNGQIRPYDHLDGKVFAICYPDNVYNDREPTLRTLSAVLKEKFPSINGIHVLPERSMSHPDLWPQDLYELLDPGTALQVVSTLTDKGILNQARGVTESLSTLTESNLAEMIQNLDIGPDIITVSRAIFGLLTERYNSHFNDGGFSQISRDEVDRRFGTTEILGEIAGEYSVMLDYVVNHLDIDNRYLEEFRSGNDDGMAFVIITPSEYNSLIADATLQKTFRPRPFPLFTGLRKYPKARKADPTEYAEEVNRHYIDEGLSPLDTRLIGFFAIFFKVQNDQGLTAEDRRCFSGFVRYLESARLDGKALFADSSVQPNQKILKPGAADDLSGLCGTLSLDPKYAEVFETHDDAIYGEKFFVYTTFSESQADINPATFEGFRLLVDDLFTLLGTGSLSMIRMDAIKYLWKEIGAKNFDMEKGNLLIEVVRSLIAIASPITLPLDEVNSPDQVVYEMGSQGGFSYLFGQVNVVPAAINSGSLSPVDRLYSTMDTLRPANLVLFVTLSTHDGRSVQGLGVDRTDGHLSIAEFADLRKVIEDRGGKAKNRAVARGSIPSDTMEKICTELQISPSDLGAIFAPPELKGGAYHLRDVGLDRQTFLEGLSKACERPKIELEVDPAARFLADWVIDGQTPYELCCTSRAAFPPASLELEAARLALAQIFVLSMGQNVPAIYFNDLLGLDNDTPGYLETGTPRDLNRKKSQADEIRVSFTEDPFTATYCSIINRAIKIRTNDPSFYPGDPNFQYLAVDDVVFINHAFARNSHSIVVGNILGRQKTVTFDLRKVSGLSGTGCSFTDALTGNSYDPEDDLLTLELAAYGAVWLVPSK